MGNLMVEHGWLGWIVVGGIAGALAKLVMPGKDPGGIIVTILLGIAGAVLMGFIISNIAGYQAGDGPGIIAAFFGAVLLLFIYRLFNRNRV